jgi:hypothetical protein
VRLLKTQDGFQINESEENQSLWDRYCKDSHQIRLTLYLTFKVEETQPAAQKKIVTCVP